MNWKRWIGIASLCMASLAANAVTPMVATGYGDSIFLGVDGTIWGAGSGQSFSGATSPIELPQLSDVIQVADTHGSALFALRSDGTLWSSGWNGSGQLGDGTTLSRGDFQPVLGLSGVKAISAAGHPLALKEDGTVWAWGSNTYGELGDGTQTDRYLPVQVSGLTNVTSISSAGVSSLALRADGTVWVWGNVCCGKSGDGLFLEEKDWARTVPTQVIGLDDVIAVAAGEFHHMALRADGTVWGWGSGASGESGNGTLQSYATPTQVPNLANVVAIAASGYRYSAALKSDGTVWTWGSNLFGQLGVSGTTLSTSSVQVTGVSDVVAISTGWGHMLALRSDGAVYAWGWNNVAQLGDGTAQDRAQAQLVLGPGGSGQLNLWNAAPASYNKLPQAVMTLSASSGTAPLAVQADGGNSGDPDGSIQSYNWSSGDGQQANGQTVSFSYALPGTYEIHLRVEDDAGGRSIARRQVTVKPAAVARPTQPKIAMGTQSAIAITNDGRVLTWGASWDLGRFDNQNAPPSALPLPAANGIAGAIDVTAGSAVHALLADGTVLGWGQSDYGEVGAGGSANQFLQPQRLLNLPPVRALASAWWHAMALTQDGRVFAWGRNTEGQLGVGDYQSRFEPAEVPALANVASIGAAYGASAVLRADGTVWAWGSINASNTPLPVPGLVSVQKISLTENAVYAHQADGTVWVYGELPAGIPDPNSSVRSAARHVPALDGFAQLAGSRNYLVGLKIDGSVWSAGLRISSTLGFATSSDSVDFSRLPGIADAIAISAVGGAAMVLRSDGTVFSWGNNERGKLGDGTLANRVTPVAVLNETGDGFLDLIPGTDFELPPSVGVPFFVVANGEITEKIATIGTKTKFNVGDLGRSGEVYVTASVPAGSLIPATSPMSAAVAAGSSAASKPASSAATAGSAFVLVNLNSSGQWQPVTNGQVLPYATGVLGDQLSVQNIMDSTDTTNLKGAQFCLGYGTSAAQMIASGTMRVVASIPDPNATGVTAPTCILAGPPVSYSLNLPQGWSLLGNSLNLPLTVASLFNDANAITSVWKWDANTLGWQFYTPLMDAAALQTYAASKGYAVLATVNPGEGYWVNAKAQPTLGTQSGDSFILTGMNLAKGWNLVATGNDITPTEFNASLKASAVPASLTTLWAWDNQQSAWYFYAPSLEAQGGTALSGYIANKGYLDFATANKKLGNGTGFWVNR